MLILDEPTRGIDIAAKLDIQRRISQLAGDGVGVVFISSELEEVVRLSDRIVVLKDRDKIGELSNGPAVTVDSVVELIARNWIRWTTEMCPVTTNSSRTVHESSEVLVFRKLFPVT